MLNPNPLLAISRRKQKGFPGWRKSREGLWLPAGREFPGYPCCCTRECLVCNFGDGGDCIVPDDMVVDLGAGGWIDDDCPNCDQILGEWTLPIYRPGVVVCRTLNWCNWVYTESPFCVGESTYNLFIQAFVYPVGEETSLPWQWRVDVMLIRSDSNPFYQSVAVYLSEGTSSSNCLVMVDEEGKIELSKSTENHLGGVCSGTLADPIYLWPDAWP